MKLPKFLFPLLVVIFFIITPLVIAFGAGYRISPHFSLYRLGVIIIDGKPKATHTYINDELIKQRFPVKLTAMVPGFYRFRFEAEGYHPLHMQHELTSGNSLVLSPLFLLQDSQPEQLISGDMLSMHAGKNRTSYFLQVREKERQLLYQISEGRPPKIIFSSERLDEWIVSTNLDDSMVSLQTDDAHIILSLEANGIFRTSHSDALWALDVAHNYFTVLDSELLRITPLTGDEKLVLSDVERLIAVDSQYAWVTRTIGDVTQLISVSLADGVITFISDSGGDLYSLNSDAPIPLATDGTTVYELQPNNILPITSYSGNRIAWESEAGSTSYLFFDTVSIVGWDGITQPHTISRFSDTIHTAEMLHGTNYIIVSHGNQLDAVHTSSLDVATTQLLTDAIISDIYSDATGEGIYVAGEIDGVAGLYYIPLRST